MPLCFAYGSNMDRAAMSARCPGSRAIGPARLPGHRLAIMRDGWLTVTRDPRREVRGLLWEVALADMPALDRYEDVASGLYTKVLQPVLTPVGARRAILYWGRDAGPGVPRPGYLEGVLASAHDIGLPPAYLRGIEALGPAETRRIARAAGGRPAVTPRRHSPLEPERDPSKGWHWAP